MNRVLSKEKSSSHDLSKYAVVFDDDLWRLYDDGSIEFVKFDFLTICVGWRQVIKAYLAETLLGRARRATTVVLTLRERFYTLRRFSGWCAEQGATSPLHVDASLIALWGRILADVGGQKRLSPRAEAMKAANVEELIRDHTACCSEVRAACSKVAQRARRRLRYSRDEARSPALDEELVLSYLRDAITVVREDAPKVIAMRAQWKLDSSTSVAASNQSLYWHSDSGGERHNFSSRAMGQLGAALAYSNENMLALVNGAALLVIALLSVMRTSELRRLQVGCVESEPDGLAQHWVINGRLSKSGRAHGWVAVDEVRAAIDVLERMGLDIRRRSKTKSLLPASLLSRRPYISARTAEGKVGTATSHSMILRMREFAVAAVPERSADARKITFRVTRRFLARFIARRDRSSLGALAIQYGHLDTQITDTYYVGSDPELARLLSEEAAVEVAQAMDDLVRSETIFTNLPPEQLQAARELMRGFLDRASTKGDVMRMLGSGVVLGPCDWGYCFYREKRARCQGDAAGPNAANRTPTVCAGCLNFSATRKHLGWWLQRVSDLEEFCRLRNIPEQAMHLAKERLKQAKEVVASIGGLE